MKAVMAPLPSVSVRGWLRGDVVVGGGNDGAAAGDAAPQIRPATSCSPSVSSAAVGSSSSQSGRSVDQQAGQRQPARLAGGQISGVEPAKAARPTSARAGERVDARPGH